MVGQFTAFVGRTQELTDIATLLADPACRLLTLVGPGGIGKTRLVLEAMKNTDFMDGVLFVPLQPLKSPDQVAITIINAFHLRPDAGIEPKQALLDYLCDANLLLILDNFEHLLEAADLVAEILLAARQVKVLVTSREPLNLREEWVREIGGLTYPINGEVSNDTNYSAVLLFAERARRLKADFSLDDVYEHVMRICAAVDGLPLALELAAGWLRTLSCKAIADEVQRDLGILTTNVRDIPERHQSMWAVFDHSWRLLNETEQAAIRYFAVFRGGYTREAAEQIAGASLPVLAGLVEKSLLRYNPDTDRYDMQELLRQYSHEHLVLAGELEKARKAHHDYYVHSLQNLTANESAATLDQIWKIVTADFDNIRTAWMWAVEHHHDISLQNMAGLIWDYAASNARCFEALDLYAAARAMLAARSENPNRGLLGQMTSYLGMCHGGLLHWESSEAFTQEALVIALELGNPIPICLGTFWLSVVLWHRGEHDLAVQRLSDNLATYHEECPPGLVTMLKATLADFSGGIGQPDMCDQLHQEVLTFHLGTGDLRSIGEVYLSMSTWAIRNGQWHQAELYLAECEQAWVKTQNIKGMIGRGSTFAQLLVRKGQMEAAQQIAEDTYSKAKKGELLSLVKNRASALVSMSLLADARGDYDTAYQQAKEAYGYARRSGDLFVITPVKFAMAWALISLEEDAEALDYLRDFLETALLWQATGDILSAVAGMTRILAHQGEQIRVSELLGLIFTHPNSPVGYFENDLPFTHLRTTLEVQLGADAFDSAWEHGIQLDPEQVLDLLRTMTSKVNSHSKHDDQKHVDALTQRELEVLRLLAVGLSNAQIADKLVISIGTVKGYVHNIYSKLDVRNRTQAVAHARDLHLL